MMNLSPFQWFYSISDEVMVEFIDKNRNHFDMMMVLMNLEIQLAEEFSSDSNKKLILN